MTAVRTEDLPKGIRVLTLDRPPANAITPQLLEDLTTALQTADQDDSVRAVVVTGAGRFFSAGLDIRGGIDFQALASTGGTPADPFAALRTCVLAFLRFSKPTVAMVQGHAIAGGLVLVLACDYRLGVNGEYRIGLNEVEIGASFPRGAFEVVRLRLTHQHASELLLGAVIYPSSQAIRLGVLDELIAADKFADTVMRRAARLGAFPAGAYAHTKAALVADSIARIESETPEEAMAGAMIWLSPESIAARAAQAQKLARG